MSPADVLLAIGADDKHRSNGEVRSEVGKEVDGRGARPVQVLKEDQQWPHSGQGLKNVEHRLEEALPFPARVQGGRFCPGGPDIEDLGKDPAETRPRYVR